MRIYTSILILLVALSAMAQGSGTEKDMPRFYELLKAQLTFPWAWQQKQDMPYGEWREAARQQVMATMQTAPPAPEDMSYEVVAREQRDGYEVQKILFWVNAWERVPAYLLIPSTPPTSSTHSTSSTPSTSSTHSTPSTSSTNSTPSTPSTNHPALLALHDHGAHFSIGKEKMVMPMDSTLRADADEWAEKCYDGQYVGDYMARNGYVVLAVDALFWGERGRTEGARYDSQQALASNMMQMGTSWGAWMVWDDIRSAEFLAQLPFVDKARVGVLGHSMGGYRAWMTAALSDRVTMGAAVCWMNDTEHLMTLTNNQNKGGSAFAILIPGLRNVMDYADVASLACPKPMLFFNGTRDRLMPVEGVENCYGRMREVWQSQGADSLLVTRLWDEKHFMNRDMQREILMFFNERVKE